MLSSAYRRLPISSLLAALAVCSLPACDSARNAGDSCSEGDEGCACYANRTCNDGLTCLSKLCVDRTSSSEPEGTSTDDDTNSSLAEPEASDDTQPESSVPGDLPGDTGSEDDTGQVGDDDGAEPDSSASDDDSPPPMVDTPVELYGQLTVKGGQLVSQEGSPVQLRGVSSMWLNWDPADYATNIDGLRFMRDSWGLQVFRAAMGVDADGAYLEEPEVNKNKVKTIIRNAIETGVYVIVDWHDHEGEAHISEAQAFFKEIASEFGDVPNVLYEVYNEPLDVSWTQTLKPYHEAVLSTIREEDPDNVVILGTPNWSQDVDVAAESPVSGDNLMYTLHFYSCTHQAELRAKADRALGSGLPLFVTEWGASDADGGLDGVVCEAEAQRWHDWMNRNKIGWAAWKLDGCNDFGCDSTHLFSSQEVSPSGGWSSSDLNGHAPFVIEMLSSGRTSEMPPVTEPETGEPEPAMSSSCSPSGTCAAGNAKDCNEEDAIDRDCSSCAILGCGVACCEAVYAFGAITQPDFELRPEIVASYTASSTAATLNMSYDVESVGVDEEMGAIAFALDQTYNINPEQLSVELSASGAVVGRVTISLEDGDAGCIYETDAQGDRYYLYVDEASPFACWGDFTASSPVSQINVRIDAQSSGTAELSVFSIDW